MLGSAPPAYWYVGAWNDLIHSGSESLPDAMDPKGRIGLEGRSRQQQTGLAARSHDRRLAHQLCADSDCMRQRVADDAGLVPAVLYP